MKKFVVFAWDAYEAVGGINDQLGSFDSLEEAIGFATGCREIWDIVDRDTWQLLQSNG